MQWATIVVAPNGAWQSVGKGGKPRPYDMDFEKTGSFSYSRLFFINVAYCLSMDAM